MNLMEDMLFFALHQIKHDSDDAGQCHNADNDPEHDIALIPGQRAHRGTGSGQAFARKRADRQHGQAQNHAEKQCNQSLFHNNPSVLPTYDGNTISQ